MEIQFTKGGQPDGGKISNFLLEKVCVLPLDIYPTSKFLTGPTQNLMNNII